MNSPDISRLYEYVILSRRKFLSQFRTLDWEEFVRNREASWNSLQGIFIHMLEVEDYLLHYDIAGKPWPFGNRDHSVFKSLVEVENYEREVTQKTRRLLGGLNAEELSREISFSEGKERATVENFLIQAFHR